MHAVHALPHLATAGLLGLVALLCGGCAGLGGDPGKYAELPALSPGRDQIIAWVPQDQAQTAGVAQALAHITLARAKKATEAELCGGSWVFAGRLQQAEAPRVSLAPVHLGGRPGWQVRIDWDPQLAECGVGTQQYAQTLSRHLPAWMMAQTGQPLVLYHRGDALYHPDGAPHTALVMSAGGR
ncbi:MAG: hypothetical protein ABR553_07205 [Gammaproteobacteria bacterium]